MIHDLFSLDLAAQIDKMARHSHPSPAYQLVEWVRLALRRKATTIEVDTRGDSLRVVDNGRGLAAAEWQALVILTDPRQPLLDREQALARLHGTLGIGLLGVFAHPPVRFTLDDGGAAGPARLRYENNQPRLLPIPPRQGTSLAIERHPRWGLPERELLGNCWGNREVWLRVDGETWVARPEPAGALITQEIGSGNVCRHGLFSLAGSGDSCRVELTDGGIPWSRIILPALDGFLCDARLERDYPLDPGALTQLAAAAGEFFQALCEGFSGYSEPIRRRLEQVLIHRHRASGDLSLLSSLPLYAEAGSPRRYSLVELRELARDHELVALPHQGEKESRLAGKRIGLQLDPRQLDFLLAGARLPVRQGQIPPPARVPNRWQRWLRDLLPAPGNPWARGHSRESCSVKERAFLTALERELAGRGSTRIPTTVVAVRTRWGGAVWPLRDRNQLGVNLGHRQIRRAIAGFSRDPAAIEWLAELLIGQVGRETGSSENSTRNPG